MSDLNYAIEKICTHYNVSPSSIAKKKYGKLEEYTYYEIIYRLLSNTHMPVHEIFKEMSYGTVAKTLQNIFPEKTGKQHWFIYLLKCVDLKKCSKCNTIKSTVSFNTSTKNEFDSLCKSCDSGRHREFYLNNKEQINLRNKTYNTNNLELVKQQRQKYYLTHQAETKARTIKYKLNKEQATPIWANLELMNRIYACKEEGEHVDHIIPLQGELVCGLHCEFNLQYLSAHDNISKGNNFNIDEYNHEQYP